MNQANLNWMYTHNAVGLIFTPVGTGDCLLLHSAHIEYAALQPQTFDDRILVAGVCLCVDRRAPHAPRADLAMAANDLDCFSVMLLIPVWAVVYNFIATMKGQWHQLGDNVCSNS